MNDLEAAAAVATINAVILGIEDQLKEPITSARQHVGAHLDLFESRVGPIVDAIDEAATITITGL